MYRILTNKKVKYTDKFCDFEMEFDINTVKQMSPEMASGSVAMCSEDAYVLYNNMDVSSK
jgi:hypothetical protein